MSIRTALPLALLTGVTATAGQAQNAYAQGYAQAGAAVPVQQAAPRLGYDAAASADAPRLDYEGAWFQAEGGLGWDALGSSATYGVGAGYDVKIGKSLVAGFGSALDLTNGTDTLLGEVDLRLGGKIGKDGPLLYGKVGYVWLRNSGVTLGGLMLGAGVEQRIADHLFVKAEYRHVNINTGLWGITVGADQVVGAVGARF